MKSNGISPMKQCLILLSFVLACMGCSYKYELVGSQPYFLTVTVPEIDGAHFYADLSLEQKERLLRKVLGFNPLTTRDILNNTVRIGMTEEQLLYAWGRPKSIDTNIVPVVLPRDPIFADTLWYYGGRYCVDVYLLGGRIAGVTADCGFYE